MLDLTTTNMKKNEGILKTSFELIIKEFQSLITVFYLLLVGVGMIFNYYKYSEFGINIFQYADAFDFLIAPFQDIFIIVFSLLSIMIPYLGLRYDSYLMKNKPKTYSKFMFGLEKKSGFHAIRKIFFYVLFVLYLIVAGSKYGNFFKNRIQDQPTLSVVMQQGAVERGKLIGKTKDILFLLGGEKVTAIPINSSVMHIEIQ